MLKALIVLPLALAAFISCGHDEKLARYRDAQTGWTIAYPASLDRTVIEEYKRLVAWRGVTISSSDRARTGEGISFRRFPPDAATFTLFQFGAGPRPGLSGPEARFPLKRSEFTPERGAPPPAALFHGMVANGEAWSVVVRFGPKASHEDKERIWQIVESIRFPPQRTGTMSGDFYVLEHASAYPTGAVVRVSGKNLPETSSYVPPFFLVHAPKGLYAVGWQPKFEPKCHMAFDRKHEQFYCRTHRGRWTRVGEVIEDPDSDLQYNHSLDVGQAKIGRDGQVLVGEWTIPAYYAAYEHRYWPRG